jgi:hypothetical protein
LYVGDAAVTQGRDEYPAPVTGVVPIRLLAALPVVAARAIRCSIAFPVTLSVWIHNRPRIRCTPIIPHQRCASARHSRSTNRVDRLLINSSLRFGNTSSDLLTRRTPRC